MTNAFSALGLAESVVAAVTAMGYETPTPVQTQAIPALLAGRDVLAAAQTGTGKTAAFSLPIITHMLAAPRARTPKSVRALVLAPTRELAAQIEENIRAYAANTSLTTALVFGGVNIRPQTEALADGVDFLVATPGRLLDHIGQHNVELAGVEFLVLDEADRMLDMGFIHDIRKLLRLVPPTRQTLLFSATFSDDIRALADTLLVNPVSVEIARNKESTLITQEAWTIDKKRKRELLRDLIVDNAWEQVLVFTRMKHTANRIADQLGKDGIVAAAIHGNKSQSARTKALAGFKDRTIRVLVATDIAARGLDIEGLPHVVNYELPLVAEDYVHRIGRTGRAGMAGHAVSLVCPDEADYLRAIEKLLKRKIETRPAEGYDGEVPEDIARDEAERDKQRAAELARLREDRKKSRAKVQKKKSAAEVHATVDATPESSDPADRFEKKIKRASAKTNNDGADGATKPRAPRRAAESAADAKSGTRTQRPLRREAGNRADREQPSSEPRARKPSARKHARREDNFGNTLDYRPARRRGTTAQWEPIDPFAPEHQALFLPQTMPAGERERRPHFTRDDYNTRDERYGNRRRGDGRNAGGYDQPRNGFGKRRERKPNIKSTVVRSDVPMTARQRPMRDSRFESVSSNLPPGMAAKFRRR